MRSGLLAVFGLAVLASGAMAGEWALGHPRRGRAFGLGLGLGAAAISVGDDSNWALGASVQGRIGLDPGNRLLLMAEFNPLGTESPVLDESFRAVNVLLGFSVGKSFKVRPSLGAQFRSWSGRERVEARDIGVLVGVDVGPELRVDQRLSIAPGVSFRYSLVEVEGRVGSRFIGLQVVASWTAAGH